MSGPRVAVVGAGFAGAATALHLARADGKGYGRAAIVGETEAKDRTVTLKTLATGQQEAVPLADLPAKLSGR